MAPGPQVSGAPPAAPGSRRYSRTTVGVGAGVSAGLVWGLAFLLPVLLGGWSPVVVTVGRYLAYGLFSVVLFALGGRGLRQVAREHWRIGPP